MTPEQVFDEVEHLNPSPGLVEITGGEPMLQERELVPLMQRLVDSGYKILLETSGERQLERVPQTVVKFVHVRCQDSGEGDIFCLETREWLHAHDDIRL